MNTVLSFLFLLSPIFRLILSFTLTVCLGCTQQSPNKNQSSKEIKILDAKKYIDQNENDRAIQLLEEMNAATPGDHEILVTLASAYAHRGKFKIQELFAIVSEITKNSNLKEKAPNESPFIQLLRQIVGFINIYQKIPLLSEAQNEDLETAILILNQIPVNALEPADLLFRGSLRFFLFRYQLGSPFEPPPPISEVFCRSARDQLTQRLLRAGDTLTLVLEDFEKAQPDNGSSLKTTRSNLEESLIQLRVNKGLNKMNGAALVIYMQIDNSEYVRALSQCELQTGL